MLSNSEMLILLNQAPSDGRSCGAFEHLPGADQLYHQRTGRLRPLRYGGALVPFKNQFPKDTELYRLMTTKPDESIIVGGKTK